MPQRVQLIKKLNGLDLQTNPIDRGEGVFIKALNVWANRESLLESRRGVTRYGAVASGSIDRQFEYKQRLLRHVLASTLQYDSDGAGTWASYTGSFARPQDRDGNNIRMRNQEGRQENFLTSSTGVLSQDELTDDPARSGIEPFLEIQISREGDPLGPISQQTQVGYFAVWGRTNASGRELRGAPNLGATLVNAALTGSYTNPAGTTTRVDLGTFTHGLAVNDTVEIVTSDDATHVGTQTVSAVISTTVFEYDTGVAPSPATGSCTVGLNVKATLTFSIPDDVVAGDFWELYRTLNSANLTTPPGLEAARVARREVSAGDITAGEISYTDELAESFLGVKIYTAPSFGASAAPNDRPPYARDLTLFKGHMFYADVEWEQELELELIDLTVVTGTSAITIDDGTNTETYTFETAENIGNKEFLVDTAGATLAERITATVINLARVVNQGSSHWYCIPLFTDESPPGRFLIRARNLATDQFSVDADTTATGDNFEPPMPTSAGPESLAPGGANVLAIAKFEQPEAVPRLSTQPLDREDDPVLRILALRDSVLVFKRTEGMYVISGETDSSVGSAFIFKQRDAGIQIFGRDTAVELANNVYLYSSQGFVRANENGVEIVGRKVEDEVEQLRQTTDWDDLAFGISYESEDLYICFGPEDVNDTFPTLAWVYNHLTRQWVNGWKKNITAGHNLLTDDKLYLAHAEDDFTLQERKDLGPGNSDYQDEVIDVTVTAISTTTGPDGLPRSLLTITYTYTSVELVAGFLFTQGSFFADIVEVTSLGGSSYQIELLEDISASLTLAAATVTIPIFVELLTSDVFGKNAAFLKQFSECHLEFESDRAFTHFLSFETDFEPDTSFQSVGYSSSPGNAGWGLDTWGDSPWGDDGSLTATPIILTLNPKYQRARRLRVGYKHNVAAEKVALSQVALVVREIGKRGARKVPRS